MFSEWQLISALVFFQWKINIYYVVEGENDSIHEHSADRNFTVHCMKIPQRMLIIDEQEA